MSKWFSLAGLPVVLALGGCDVQVQDQTPASYPANHEVGMYEVKAAVTRDALVSDGSVYVFALDGTKKLELTPDAQGNQWHGLYSVRCRSSFPLQFRVVWNKQGLSTGQKLVPDKPREVLLTPPPLTSEVAIDTSAKSPKGWMGTVPYRFVTAEHTQITAAHIEPLSQDPADVAAAKPITIDTVFPLDAQCAMPAEISVSSKVARAQGTLVIDTDLPALPHWQTKVTFAPK